jgi:hypothetical protein
MGRLYLRVRSQRRPKLGRGVEVGWRGYANSEDEIEMTKMTRFKMHTKPYYKTPIISHFQSTSLKHAKHATKCEVTIAPHNAGVATTLDLVSCNYRRY